MKKILALCFNLVIAAIAVSVTGGGALAAVGICGALSLAQTGMQGLGMAVQVEIWENDIVESLWADNAFMQYAYNADQYVLAGKVVHIPQSGAAPGTEVNRSTLPATVTQRTDTDVTYAIDEITTDPVHIANADTVELSYDKRKSVLSESTSAINESAALNMLYRWSPSVETSIIRTSGAGVDATCEGATGQRCAITLKDIKKAQKQFNKWNIPSGDRYIMLDADMYEQLTDEMTANDQRDFLKAYDEKTGVCGQIYGFKVLQRSQVMRYTNAATPAPRKWSLANAATDNAAALCWHKNSVERALGTVKFFETLGDATYYGDIYSSLVRIGGRVRRNDSKGVLAIVQSVYTAPAADTSGTK